MRVGIAATVKDEAPYLLEWIAFHRVVGIEVFFIADNGGIDGTSDLLRQLEELGYITRFDFIGQTAPQTVTYDTMVPRMQDVVDLVAMIDADEFIRPVEGGRADFGLQRYFENPNVSAVAINWACYGTSNHIRRREGLVLERFKMRSELTFDTNRHVKSVVRVDRYRSYENPHFINITGGRYIDTSGSDIEWDAQFGYGVSTRCLWDKFRVDHFIVKSLEEFETIKCARGRGDLPPGHPSFRRDREFFDIVNRNDVYDPMTANLVDETKNEIQRIQSRLKCSEPGVVEGMLPLKGLAVHSDHRANLLSNFEFHRTAKDNNTPNISSRNASCPCGSGKRFKHCHGKYV